MEKKKSKSCRERKNRELFRTISGNTHLCHIVKTAVEVSQELYDPALLHLGNIPKGLWPTTETPDIHAHCCFS